MRVSIKSIEDVGNIKAQSTIFIDNASADDVVTVLEGIDSLENREFGEVTYHDELVPQNAVEALKKFSGSQSMMDRVRDSLALDPNTNKPYYAAEGGVPFKGMGDAVRFSSASGFDGTTETKPQADITSSAGEQSLADQFDWMIADRNVWKNNYQAAESNLKQARLDYQTTSQSLASMKVDRDSLASTLKSERDSHALLNKDWARLRRAVSAVYLAAWWKGDRQVDEAKLWTTLRDAAFIPDGEASQLLGPKPVTTASVAGIDGSPLFLALVNFFRDVTTTASGAASSNDALDNAKMFMARWRKCFNRPMDGDDKWLQRYDTLRESVTAKRRQSLLDASKGAD